jgi:hypothetical protein
MHISQNSMPEPRVATLDEVARILRISRGGVYAAAKRGDSRPSESGSVSSCRLRLSNDCLAAALEPCRNDSTRRSALPLAITLARNDAAPTREFGGG